ncbi:hypothetical protein [Polyangium sp. 6x1]|uniref:tyrosine-type recombinase/integrase n=1 Tax=Polyangium sp. 6x1 TaxID=3042689 RepID=UPI0024828466|nr:hypothetical protein [Polyangium sp. 6x1]MDI1451758.1 hypothetical protein [Polyangium sp. 6x1]
MALRKVMRREKPRVFIDIRFRKKDGTRGRLRKDAQVQTLVAARAEEKRYQLAIAQHGEPYVASGDGAAQVLRSGKSFAEVVGEFKSTFMITELKVTSRKGYEGVLDATLVPRFGGRGVDEVDGVAAGELDLELSKRELSQSTRNNTQIVLRSVLRFAKARGYIARVPEGLPRLKSIGQCILEIPTDEEVDRILAAASASQRLAFGLMAYAGLRPNEVRGLRRRDVRLRWEGEAVAGGFVSVREGRSFGETHTPKTGQREVPVTPELGRLLAPVEAGAREELVAMTARGKPWGAVRVGAGVREGEGSGGVGGVVGVLPAALCDYVVVTGWGAGACGAEDGGA